MNNKFIKEIFWKNDLTYLCLCLPFILLMNPVNTIIHVVVIVACVLLAYSWRMTFKKRYIFNSQLKYFIVIALALTTFSFLPVTHSNVKAFISLLELVFIALYSLYVMTTAYCLFVNTDEHYEYEYHSELEDSYKENDYRRSIYSIMQCNNIIAYQYDKNIDVYLHYGKLYEEIVHSRFGFHIQNAGKNEISWLHDYIAYLDENSLSSKKMNKDDFSVFRMFAI